MASRICLIHHCGSVFGKTFKMNCFPLALAKTLASPCSLYFFRQTFVKKNDKSWWGFRKGLGKKVLLKSFNRLTQIQKSNCLNTSFGTYFRIVRNSCTIFQKKMLFFLFFTVQIPPLDACLVFCQKLHPNCFVKSFKTISGNALWISLMHLRKDWLINLWKNALRKFQTNS